VSFIHHSSIGDNQAIPKITAREIYPEGFSLAFLISDSHVFIILVDSPQAILLIADEDGNYLQEAWEHILTCVSRFENLHLVGEGAPPDATFFALQQPDLDKSKQSKSSILPVLKKKAPNANSASKRGSYDSAGVGGKASGVDQMNNEVTNLLEQVGMAEMNRVFVRSQKLNSEGIIDFVKALCKVSVEELRSASDPRVFSLTKIVEIA
jgi:brefeldin A-inhibited guanine nucleotide-exchange protein